MYEYKGEGAVIGISEFGDVHDFLNEVNGLFGTNYTDISDFDDDMFIGTYEYYDNILSAEVNGNEVNYDEGVIILSKDENGVYDDTTFTRMDILMGSINYTRWFSDDRIAGTYCVTCEQ